MRLVLERLGGRTRARTWDPMIKSQPYVALIQRAFRHVHVSSSIEITMEFSFVGIQGRRERVIGSIRMVGSSTRQTATVFPSTTVACLDRARLLGRYTNALAIRQRGGARRKILLLLYLARPVPTKPSHAGAVRPISQTHPARTRARTVRPPYRRTPAGRSRPWGRTKCR